jgi:hypothetical protein
MEGKCHAALPAQKENGPLVKIFTPVPVVADIFYFQDFKVSFRLT